MATDPQTYSKVYVNGSPMRVQGGLTDVGKALQSARSEGDLAVLNRVRWLNGESMGFVLVNPYHVSVVTMDEVIED